MPQVAQNARRSYAQVKNLTCWLNYHQEVSRSGKIEPEEYSPKRAGKNGGTKAPKYGTAGGGIGRGFSIVHFH